MGKKFKRYLFEFIMLFMAVTLGFFVENWRERISESQREKQFIQLLLNDLIRDTLRLNIVLANRIERDSIVQTMLLNMESGLAMRHTGDFYFHGGLVSRISSVQFISNDGTIQQLKNADGLNLISSVQITDSIIRYDTQVRFLSMQLSQEMNGIDLFRLISPKIFNWKYMNRMSDGNNKLIAIDIDPPLQRSYPDYLDEFAARAVSLRNLNRGQFREGRKLQKQARNLIVLLKKEYAIE